MDWRVRQGTDPGCAIGGASCPISDRSPLHRLRVPQVSILRPGIPRNSIASFKITRWATYARLRKLDARTTNGGVTVSMPERYSAHFETATSNGNLRVDFPMTVRGEIGKNLATDIGSGGPTIHVETINGGVNVKKI